MNSFDARTRRAVRILLLKILECKPLKIKISADKPQQYYTLKEPLIIITKFPTVKHYFVMPHFTKPKIEL